LHTTNVNVDNATVLWNDVIQRSQQNHCRPRQTITRTARIALFPSQFRWSSAAGYLAIFDRHHSHNHEGNLSACGPGTLCGDTDTSIEERHLTTLTRTEKVRDDKAVPKHTSEAK